METKSVKKKTIKGFTHNTCKILQKNQLQSNFSQAKNFKMTSPKKVEQISHAVMDPENHLVKDGEKEVIKFEEL